MIIVQLTGGIGNQLFQFAIGKALSIKLNQKLLIDISSFQWDPLRNFSLDKILNRYALATTEDIVKVKSTIPRFTERIFYKLIGKEIPYYKRTHIKEIAFTFDENFFLYSSKHLYLEGYWQSEKYFNFVRKEILSAFNLVNYPMSESMQLFKQKIEHATNSVSIHVRRGDYELNPETNTFHGVCSLEYYERAMKEIEKKVSHPTYFVFSDDKNYVREIFGSSVQVEIVEGIPLDEEELLLMSFCKHQIIANSSFSWWGAWLNQYKQKIVIAPNDWFLNKEMQQQSVDLIPESWVKL